MSSLSSANCTADGPREVQAVSSLSLPANPIAQASGNSFGYGQLRLPEGQVVHIIPSQPAQPIQRLAVPFGFVFASAIGAMLQAQTPEKHDMEYHISEPVQFLASKVVRVEWPQGPSNFSKGNNSSTNKKRKKEKKKETRDSSKLFDGIAFFQKVQTYSDAACDFAGKEIVPVSEQLSEEAERLSHLRNVASQLCVTRKSL